MWGGGGGCGEVGVGGGCWELGVGMGRWVWVWRGGCGEVDVDVGMEKLLYKNLHRTRLYLYLSNQLFSVIAVWSAKQIGGCACGW